MTAQSVQKTTDGGTSAGGENSTLSEALLLLPYAKQSGDLVSVSPQTIRYGLAAVLLHRAEVAMVPPDYCLKMDFPSAPAPDSRIRITVSFRHPVWERI